MHSSEKTIIHKYSDIPSDWFWQCRTQFIRISMSEFVIPCRFCILYGWNCKQLRTIRCIVDRDMFNRDSACLILRRGLFSNNKCRSSTFWSLTRGLPLPPMCSIFPSCRNRVWQHRIVLREARVLCIAVWIHLFVTVIESVLIYLATTCAFWASVNAIFPIFFRVMNLDLICVRSRFCRILCVHKDVLHDYHTNQQGLIITFYMTTWIILWPISWNCRNAFFTVENLMR